MSDLKELYEQYIVATIKKDIDTLSLLFDDHVVYDSGHRSAKEKENVLLIFKDQFAFVQIDGKLIDYSTVAYQEGNVVFGKTSVQYTDKFNNLHKTAGVEILTFNDNNKIVYIDQFNKM